MIKADTRVCTKCGERKHVSEFWKRSKGDGLRRQCKQCHHEYRADPDFIARRQASARERKYGLSQEGYEELLDRQGFRCAICCRKRKLSVDHDHQTGEVRGLLCSSCNLILGHSRDDVRLLIKAVRYLLD